MKALKNNIFHFLKAIFAVLCVVCMLSACTSTDDKSMTVIDGKLTGEENDLSEQQRSCWQAELLAAFYDAMAASSLKAYPKVTQSAMPFMMVAFALWLAIRILKHVSSVVEESPSEVWTEVARMGFVCLVCGLLASSTTFLLFTLNKIVLPVYYAFLEYGSEVLNALTQSEDMSSDGIYLGKPKEGFCIVYTNTLSCQAPTPSQVDMAQAHGVFPPSISEMMQCLTCATSDRMQIGFTLSTFLMTMHTLSAVLCGLVLFAVFAIVKVAFVFYMIDSIFRMNIMVILLPCFIMAYPFKFTRKWTKIGFLSVLGSAAIMAFIAILIAMSLLAMQYVLVDNSDLFGTREHYTEFGVIPLSLILIAFLVLKSISLAVALAGSIVGGSTETDFQRKIASLAAQMGKRVFSAITGGLGKVLLKSQTIQKMKDARDRAKTKLDHWAGRD